MREKYDTTGYELNAWRCWKSSPVRMYIARAECSAVEPEGYDEFAQSYSPCGLISSISEMFRCACEDTRTLYTLMLVLQGNLSFG